MKKRNIKKILTWIIVPLMASFFIIDMITIVIGNAYQKRYMPVEECFTFENGDDRIHFLNTANSDCILLESNGHFAMIDAGEGDYNPRRKTEYKGYEKQVLSYLRKVAENEEGMVHLDFILGTHYHYDHIGNFTPVIKADDIIIDKAYFKVYNPEMDKDYEIDAWGLPGFYEDISSNLKEKNIPLISDIPEYLEFGDFTLNLYNTGYYEDLHGRGENSSSIGIKVTKGNKSAFLAADITAPSGLEKKLSGLIGDIDLLKVGHHGYFGSSSQSFLSELKPEIAVVTNHQGKVYPNVKWNLTMFAKVPFYGTYDYNGIIATFTDDGKIILTNNIHDKER